MEIHISVAWGCWSRDLGHRHSWLGFLWSGWAFMPLLFAESSKHPSLSMFRKLFQVSFLFFCMWKNNFQHAMWQISATIFIRYFHFRASFLSWKRSPYWESCYPLVWLMEELQSSTEISTVGFLIFSPLLSLGFPPVTKHPNPIHRAEGAQWCHACLIHCPANFCFLVVTGC